jgi:ABC-type phosphate/phosphonate transport system substrate-binding protein
MDKHFKNTLLNAIIKLSDADHKELFPANSSTFYSKFLQPYRPKGIHLDIHHSTYKKVTCCG